MSTRICASHRALFLIAVAVVGCDHSEQISEVARPTNPQFSSFDGSTWSDPVNLGPVVNSNVLDQQAAISPDGLSLYFVSARSGGLGLNDIWVSHRATPDSPWETPVNLGAPINTASSDAAPSFSADGHLLFFQSDRPGGAGSSDVYVSRRSHTHDNTAWGEPVALGDAVNTSAFEGGVKFSPSAEDGAASFYFGRGLVATDLDIYYAPLARDGSTRGPAVLVSELSMPSPVTDGHASVRHDGREVFIHSTRPGNLGVTDIYVSVRRSVHHPWSTPTNLGAPINSAATEGHPTLSHDGRTLFFSSNRPGGMGANDLWMVTRSPKQ